MQKINWIILVTKDRGTDYGVGTYIRQLSQGLNDIKNVNVFVIEFDITSTRQNVFLKGEQDGINTFRIVLRKNIEKIHILKRQEKLFGNVVKVLTQYIPKSSLTIIHMNLVFQLLIAKELKKVYNGYIIYTQHVYIEIQREGHYDFESETCKFVDKIVTVTKHGKEHLIEKGVDKGKIEVIYNGITPNIINRKAESIIWKRYGLKRSEKLVLFSGRIDEIKGLDYLCFAFNELLEKLPNCRLIIAGNGNFEELIKSSRKFSSKVSYLGFVPHEDIISLYHEADIGVIPSLEEHCSYVALEMLFAGLPVVASSLGGLKEIFEHRENALLAETIIDKTNRYGISPKIDHLVNSMYELLTDNSLSAKISFNAKKRANDIFTTEQMIINYLKIIKDFT